MKKKRTINNPADIAWAAGLFEGEGWLTISRDMRRNHSVSGTVGLQMTDLDVVQKFQNIIGFGSIISNKPNNKLGKKMLHKWKVQTFELVQAVIAMLYSFMGKTKTT